jgi:cytochrome bd-type quinol oxidase subunit 2
MILHELITYETLRLVWWLLIGVLLVGFAVTDGFDLGANMLLPFAGRTDLERRVIINSVGPVWEGNQVWLIVGGAALFAAWPQLYAVSFSGFYLAMFAVLVPLILRPVAIKFRSKHEDAAWRTRWDWTLFVTGLVPALIFGVAVGNVLQGVPFRLAPDMRIFYEGSFFGLLNPFALLCGLVSLAMLAMHGSAWLQLKAAGPVAERARSYGSVAALLTLLLYALAGLVLWSWIDGYRAAHGRPVESAAEDRGPPTGRLVRQLRGPPVAVDRSGPRPRGCVAGLRWDAHAARRDGAAGQRAGHRRHHPQRRRLDVPLHPALVAGPARQPHGVGLLLEPPDAVHHAGGQRHLHPDHRGVHQLGLQGDVGQGRRRCHPRRARPRLLIDQAINKGTEPCGTSPGCWDCPLPRPSRCSMRCGTS